MVVYNKSNSSPLSEMIVQNQNALCGMLRSIINMIEAFNEREKYNYIHDHFIRQFEYQLLKFTQKIYDLQRIIILKKRILNCHFSDFSVEEEKDYEKNISSCVESAIQLISNRIFVDESNKEQIKFYLTSILKDSYNLRNNRDEMNRFDHSTQYNIGEKVSTKMLSAPWIEKGIYRPKKGHQGFDPL